MSEALEGCGPAAVPRSRGTNKGPALRACLVAAKQSLHRPARRRGTGRPPGSMNKASIVVPDLGGLRSLAAVNQIIGWSCLISRYRTARWRIFSSAPHPIAMPGPEAGVAGNGAGPALDLDQEGAPWPHAEHVHLVNRTVVCDELEIRPHMNVGHRRQRLPDKSSASCSQGNFEGETGVQDIGPKTSAKDHPTEVQKASFKCRIPSRFLSLVELNPADAEDLGISAYEKILVASRRGKVTATAFLTNTVQKGQVFIPMHYAVANELAFPAVDPYSRQPAYMACAVCLRSCD